MRETKTRPVATVLGLVLVFLLALMAPGTANAKITLKDKVGDKEIKVKMYGFSQFEMRGGDGQSAEGGLFFKAQRIRVGFNYFHGPIAGKLFLDFNQSHTDDSAGLPKMIKDAFVAYKWSNSAFIRLGMIKTPLHMSFTNPGWNLDIAERNLLDKGLALERDFGLMLSGRLIGQPADKKMKCNGLEMGRERRGYGFGYDIGVFNPAGRSKVVKWDKAVLGDALAYVGRIHYDHGRPFHFEMAYGISEKAGGPNTEDYSVFSIGALSSHPNWEASLEYTSGHNLLGVEDWDQDTWTLMGGYMVGRNVEAVIKHYQSSADKPTAGESDLSNTYIGINWYLSPLRYKARDFQRHKLVFNYIIASGDTDSWTGKGGYLDDGWIIQWQYKF
jgi:hypothetical protein